MQHRTGQVENALQPGRIGSDQHIDCFCRNHARGIAAHGSIFILSEISAAELVEPGADGIDRRIVTKPRGREKTRIAAQDFIDRRNARRRFGHRNARVRVQ